VRIWTAIQTCFIIDSLQRKDYVAEKPKIIRGTEVDAQGNAIGSKAWNVVDIKQPAEPRHKRLSEEQEKRAYRTFKRAGRYVTSPRTADGRMTLELWKGGFLFDANPDRELSAWETICEVFDLFATDIPDPSQRVSIIASVSAGMVDVAGHTGVTDELVGRIKTALATPRHPSSQ
jgi:hypothetical protein